MKKKISIFCTLGPSSLKKDFLKFSNKKVDLLRLNMSHINPKNLKRIIKFIRKYTSTPICIDTEGAQIRTKIIKNKKIKKNSIINLFKNNKDFSLYPDEVFSKLRKNDILDVGFDNLKFKILNKNKKFFKLKCLSNGMLENNKGVHLINRNLKLNSLTNKDKKSLEIGLQNNIKNYALSFTNTAEDVILFSKKLPLENKIFKLETKNALKNINKIFNIGSNFLIDRGDLSKDVGILNTPISQRFIFKKAKKLRKKRVKIYVATNFLESMINKPYPTRAELNDIYNSLELGADGLVLAAETAIGKYPKECVTILNEIIKLFKKRN